MSKASWSVEELDARFRSSAVFDAGQRIIGQQFVRYYPVNGGLVSYGPNSNDLYRRAADYIDHILKGEKAWYWLLVATELDQ